MILEVHHETRLEYAVPVIESLAEVRMEPLSDEQQSLRSFHLSVSPYCETFRFLDGLGSRVHHFNLLISCQQIRIVAGSIVETHPQPCDWTSTSARYPLCEEDIELPARSMLGFHGPVRWTNRLNPLLRELSPSKGMPLGELVERVSACICERFEYAKHVTLASSPVDDVLREGKGVCQDFTHLMIAILRSFGVPARYVSGYVHRPNKESQSHAWCEAWLPDLGWCGIDPTNNRRIDEHFVKVATGRDFTDVPPNKGVYRGKSHEQIFVRVETRQLDRLPTLNWQETAPTFEVPLLAIASRDSSQEGNYAAVQQQQQQQ